ncbi:MAG: membrane protein insertase YidC, partial [Novosphingobium sp.]|nr:membrane protein insertase YidC [Novosphingobium sp.]
MQNQRNLILAVLLTALLLFGWDAAVRHFYPQPPPKPRSTAGAPAAVPSGSEPQSASKPTREGGLTSEADQAVEAKDLQSALVSPTRVRVEAPGLSGSINLVGAVVDDLVVNRHTATVSKNSPPQRIFSPAGTPAQQFAQFGWAPPSPALPGPNTVWTAPAGAKLTPDTPLTLTWSNGQGQDFAIRFTIDRDYLITVTQTVANRGAAPVTLHPIAEINRTDRTASLDSWNIHS